ncbi:hypothetical protein CSUI_009105 [Cystoisospora suis]|uniref:Uncharacterized protein n=1 Tax=Cystoisospora suis TaxID=483139 RepID=A0A2C6KL31_9APIC|nr:hypothetical protein CSUI_009105 [Cystoisospora suis]
MLSDSISGLRDVPFHGTRRRRFAVVAAGARVCGFLSRAERQRFWVS